MNPRIERAYLDGSNRQAIVDLSSGSERHWVNGITIDVVGGRLYWVTGNSKSIFLSNLDGTERKELTQLNSEATLFYGVAVHGSYVYWSDAATRRIERRRKLPEGDPDHRVIINNGQMPLGMEIFHQNRETSECVCACACVCVCVCVCVCACVCVHGILYTSM